jgi:DNA-binding NarL/FixJ family response regulator
MRVLVVDDSSLVRERLSVMVREWPGVEPCEAADADEALAMARRNPPDVVLLDLHLPGRGGLGAIAEFKGLSPAPVVVVITYQPTEHHRCLCISKGADFFFDKAADLSAVVRAAVGLTATELPSDTPSRNV